MKDLIRITLYLAGAALLISWSCSRMDTDDTAQPETPYLYVLGIAQDGGIPQTGDFDHPGWNQSGERHQVVSLGLVDPATRRHWMFEATPDFPRQLTELHRESGFGNPQDSTLLNGIFLTHAHMGHYTGLMFLGYESLSADRLPVYAMPEMRRYLRENGPWSQLVTYHNIELRPLTADSTTELNSRLTVTPIPVPHRQEFSEVVGYRIQGPNSSALFIPDIDTWDEWGRSLEVLVSSVDYAFLDGTFYDDGELPGRDMSGIPHPRIIETMDRLQHLPDSVRNGIHFIHFNHTNPVLKPGSPERDSVLQRGFNLALEGMRFPM